MPTWVQAGGLEEWIKRLKDPGHPRARDRRDENAGRSGLGRTSIAARAPTARFLLAFKNPALKPLTGKRLSDVAAHAAARARRKPRSTWSIEDGSRVGVAYFLMSEDERRDARCSFPGSASARMRRAEAPEGVFLKSASHPRAYGNVARLLGHYVRDEKLIPLQEAVRRPQRDAGGEPFAARPRHADARAITPTS